jgi:hypothetical protein
MPDTIPPEVLMLELLRRLRIRLEEETPPPTDQISVVKRLMFMN